MRALAENVFLDCMTKEPDFISYKHGLYCTGYAAQAMHHMIWSMIYAGYGKIYIRLKDASLTSIKLDGINVEENGKFDKMVGDNN